MKYLLIVLFAVQMMPLLAGEPTLVYLVRHAEKVDESRDPELSPAGLERVALLNRFFERIELDHVISTQFKRTKGTVKAIAAAQNLSLEIMEAGQEQKVAETVKSGGGVFLISGHSNTVPEMIKLLGGPQIHIPHDGYSNVFLLILDGENAVFQNFLLDPRGH